MNEWTERNDQARKIVSVFRCLSILGDSICVWLWLVLVFMFAFVFFFFLFCRVFYCVFVQMARIFYIITLISTEWAVCPMWMLCVCVCVCLRRAYKDCFSSNVCVNAIEWIYWKLESETRKVNNSTWFVWMVGNCVYIFEQFRVVLRFSACVCVGQNFFESHSDCLIVLLRFAIFGKCRWRLLQLNSEVSHAERGWITHIHKHTRKSLLILRQMIALCASPACTVDTHTVNKHHNHLNK